ncbi:MAG TPA: discoidin domain-containing protein, partial [Firmicutes bacterium]|nr:discoidin domain-containing protein [Bacillota bacterium]
MKKPRWKAILAAMMSVFLIFPVTAPVLAAGADDGSAGPADALITETLERADTVLAHLENGVGEGAYQADPALYDALEEETQQLRGMLGAADTDEAQAQIDKVESGISALLQSVWEGESLIVDVPQSMMGVSANSYNPGYPPSNAVDGNPDSIWHSEWAPENDPFPHIFTIDLYQTTALYDISITPRLDAEAGRITSGEIYAGSSLENMQLVTAFTGDAGADPIVVDLDGVSARYIQIYSLAASSANTAISEIGVRAYERPVATVPVTMMSAEASTSNAGYPPANAIDGNTATMWHSEWSPENVPFPHIFTLDLGKKMLLDTLSILPRQDGDAGKTTRGQIYAGDSPEDMVLVTEFTADASRNAAVVDLRYTAARYIQIHSLEANSANTAIAEISVTTYDLAMVAAFSQYDDALDLLRKAVVGDQVGNYTAADREAYAGQLQAFAEELEQEGLTPADYADIVQRMEAACEAFILKAKAYTKDDLAGLAESLEALAGQLQNAKDKENAAALLEEAGQIQDDPDATREELHDICVKVGDFVKAMNASDGTYDLSGEWGVALSGYEEGQFPESRVNLPGTLDTNKIGTYNALRDMARLSRSYTYTGPATYQKELYVSEALADKNISLYMERTRQTRVWVNGTEVLAPDSSNILPVAQQYDITSALRFGDYNTIVIQVDNSYAGLPQNGIKASHMATDETQTNWNGIVGEFKLQAREKVYIDDLRVYPNEDLQSVTVEADIRNSGGEDYTGKLHLACEGTAGRDIDVSVTAGGTTTFTVEDYAMPADVQLWSEFDTPLYALTAALENGGQVTASFGMRAFRSEGTDFTVNGDKVFLRSEANCAVFPLTGYAPMDVEEWEALFATYKSYGVNMVRFHSWCPPEAAFQAADKLGLYLQPELSCWAGGMLGDETNRNYYTREAFAILKEYANHPSFVMLTFGNELGYNGNDYLEQGDKLVQDLQAEDATRLYAPGSNVHFGSLDPTPHSDFYTAQNYGSLAFRGSYGGLNGFLNQNYPSAAVNFDDVMEALDAFDLPAFSFEVGQYQVFPDVLTEPERYTGALEARNLQTVLERLEEKGYTEEYIRQAIEASGMLSRLGYKAEIEAALRTEGMDGISLLGLQDFSGQGTALVGMMNAFGEPKPYDFADPEAFSDFFAPVVPLLETEKFSWTNDETLTGRLLISNYSPEDLEESITYTLTDRDGQVFYEGKTDTVRFAQGSLTEAGTLSIPLSDITEPTQFKLEITCQSGKNSYNLWVYPADETVSEGEVYVTEYLDELALQVLEEGGKVFLSPKASGDALPNSRDGRFSTAFWSTNDQTQPGTLGLLMDPEHPLFDAFPTDYHSDYQWWAMSRQGRAMNLESLTDAEGNHIQPLVTVIDGGFGDLDRLGLLYEAAVGNGKLMVSSMGLDELQYDYPEAKALRNAILEYMNSDAFNPTFQLTVEQINEQVKAVEGSEQENLAYRYNGGEAFLGENTETCDGGYDNKYTDRILEINDGLVDLSTGARSWTDFNGDQNYPNDVQIGVELAAEYTVDTVAFAFYEDAGCAAPVSVRVQYWNGQSYVDVPRQDKSDGFTAGMNTITFAPVQTDKLLFIMEHADKMAVAISEMFVYERQVDPTAIQIRAEGDAQTVRLNETLQLYIDTQPEYANNRNVKWTVTDEAGNPTELARVGFDGILRPAAVGKVIIHAELRSDPSITATLEIEIVEDQQIIPGDLTGDGKVSIEDVMAACRVIARKANGQQPLPDELARGDMNDDGKMLI